MMLLNQYEIESRLQISMMRYGLNPNDWSVQDPSPVSGLQSLKLTSKSSKNLELEGKAMITKCGNQFIAVWRSMRLLSSEL